MINLKNLSSVKEIRYLFNIKEEISNEHWVYYIRIISNKGIYYKIGACKELNPRLYGLGRVEDKGSYAKGQGIIIEDIRPIAAEILPSKRAARRIEKCILIKYKQDITKDLIVSSGNTEIFNRDIFGIDMDYG